MGYIQSTTQFIVARNTPCIPKYRLLDEEGEPVDLTSYNVKFAVKEYLSESASYLLEPLDGTVDSDGNISADISADQMSQMVSGSFVGEFVVYLDGIIVHRIQIPFIVKGIVISPNSS